MPSELLSLTKLVASGEELLFDGNPISSGIHLRWSYAPILGPPDEFIVYRGDVQDEALWNEIARLPFPSLVPNVGEDVIFERVHEDLEAGGLELVNHYQNGASSFVELAQQVADVAHSTEPDASPLHQAELPEVGRATGSRTRLRLVDMLLLASLDPYLARMQGLYWIDPFDKGDKPPSGGNSYRYRVMGDWGSRNRPAHRLDFRRLEKARIQHDELKLDDVELSIRRLSLYLPKYDEFKKYDGPHLVLSGSPSLPLDIRFPFPAAEVIIHLAVPKDPVATPPGEWKAFGNIHPVVPRVEENRLVFKATSGKEFQNLVVIGPAGPWRFTMLDYREKLGGIGQVYSESVEVHLPPTLDLIKTPSVVSPRLTELRHDSIPSALDPETGEIPSTSSQVELACNVIAPSSGHERPVRLIVGRSPSPHNGEPQKILTRSEGFLAPALYSPPSLDVSLPELLASWPFDRHTRDIKTGQKATIHGAARFTRGHPEEKQRSVLKLDQKAFVTCPLRQAFQYPGSTLTLSLWVKAALEQEELETMLIDNDRHSSYGLGLVHEGNRYRPRFWLYDLAMNTSVKYDSNGLIRAEHWEHIAVVYSGNELRFYLNGEATTVVGTSKAPVQPNPKKPPFLYLGAESGSTTDAPRLAFRGLLADIQIWQQALPPDEANDRFRRHAYALSNQTSVADIVFSWSQVIEITAKTPFVDTGHRPELQSLGEAFTLQLWFFAERGLELPTLIGNNYNQSFWLGLLHEGSRYRARFYLNGTMFEATTFLDAEQWHHLTVRYDGSELRFFLNGKLDATRPAALGPLQPNRRSLLLGAESGSTVDAPNFPFRGQLAEIGIWQAALTPQEALDRLAATQYIDRPVPDGDYMYRVSGVDLFGRASEWSKPVRTQVTDKLPPPPPVDLRVQYRPLLGNVVSVTSSERIQVQIPSLAKAVTEAGFDTSEVLGYDLMLIRHIPASETTQARTYRQPLPITSISRQGGESFEIEVETPPFAQLQPQTGVLFHISYDLSLEVKWAWTGLQRLFYPRTQEFHIYRRRGPLHTLRGKATTVLPSREPERFTVNTDITDMSSPDLVNSWCQVGASLYRVLNYTSGDHLTLTVQYEARPTIKPQPDDLVILNVSNEAPDYRRPESWRETPISHPIRDEAPLRSRTPAQWRAPRLENYDPLERHGVNWLPKGQVFILRLPMVDFLDGSYASPSPDAFIPGAVVARSGTDNQYQAYNVLWEAREGNDLLLYLQNYDAGVKPQPSELSLDNARYYPGQRYHRMLTVPNTFAPGEPTAEWALGLTTADVTGNESAVGQIASAVAVNRQRSPAPPRPEIVAIDRADFHGNSKVMIRWEAVGTEGDGTRYQLYRAVDTSVFTRDLEQRRLRTGHYDYEEMTPEQVFADDRDFTDWLPVIARRLGMADLVSGWQTRLFASRPRDLRPEGEPSTGTDERRAWDAKVQAWQAWDNATPVWRAWADRLYPALTNDEVVVLAELAGNESAFALVNSKPLKNTAYVDSVNGRVTNRYLYRLRTQSVALHPSTGYGPPSAPQAPPKILPPRVPVFTKIEAGDRQITLHWALNREPDLAEYRLYRSESPEDLEDLRWWGDEADPRLVATIVDPRLRVNNTDASGSHLSLPPLSGGTAPMVNVLGVYRLDQDAFDYRREPLTDQPETLNYYQSFDSTSLTVWLLRIAIGTPVVIVYNDAGGVLRLLDRRSSDEAGAITVNEPPEIEAEDGTSGYEGLAEGVRIDEDLLGLQNYYYRLTVVDETGNISPFSRIVKARTSDETLPVPPLPTPAWIDSGGGVLQARISWTSEFETLLQRRVALLGQWQSITSWQPPGTYAHSDTTANSGVPYEYRLWARKSTGAIAIGEPVRLLAHDIRTRNA